jgi:cyclic di-GMP phosphodiesterase
MPQIKRIPIAKLEVGMYVSEQNQGIAGGTLNQRGLVQHQKTIDKLASRPLTEIYIDTEKGIDCEFSVPVETNTPPYVAAVTLEKERVRAEAVHAEALSLVDNIMHDVKLGKVIDVAATEDLADEINVSVFNNRSALLCLSQIREKDRYLLEHSINVGILMGIFSRHLGYADDIVHQLITGAILHDIGKILVPNEILHKPGKLTNDEWEEMKRHVTYGQQTLLKSEGISDIAMVICSQHHERLDGTGYPLTLTDTDISVYGRLAAIVDVYDAITASRVYHDGMTPFVAMKRLLEWSGDHLDKTLVYHFIRCMSVYPVGTLVELNNGKVGIVIETNATKPDSPIVKVIYNARHNHHEPATILDLSNSRVEAKVVNTRDPKELQITLGDFL